MQENRRNGTEVITEGATPEQISSALATPDNQSVHVYMPGSIVVRAGQRYIVDSHGSFRRVHPKQRRQKGGN